MHIIEKKSLEYIKKSREKKIDINMPKIDYWIAKVRSDEED